VKAILRQCNIEQTNQKWTAKDYDLDAKLRAKQATVREAICDDFNTPKAINELFELVTVTNGYLSQDPKDLKIPLVRCVSKFVFHILKCFGIYEDGDYPSVSGSGDNEGAQSQEELIAPLMNALSKYRDQVKNSANDDPKALFKISDELRDNILPYLGIRLEDKGKAASIWKYEKPEILIKELEAKEAEKAKKEADKQAKKDLDFKKKSTSGKDFFKVLEADGYSKFDAETGLPTHDKNDKALSEAIVNGLKKKQNKQETVYQKWLKEQEAATGTEESKN
jgi:cysteinyl-tRNA synthetase